MRRRTKGATAKAWLGSILVHGTVVALALVTTVVDPVPIEYETFEIEMYSPPAEDPADELPRQEEELVVETPEPDPPEPDEPEPDPVEEPPVKPPETTPQPPPDPEPDPESEPDQPADINVQLEGLQRDYPVYYRHLIIQIQRCFRPPEGRWEATIDFVINRDGSVAGRDIVIHRRSGNTSFDILAVAAVECAGKRLNPLPDDLPYERLPIRFNFSPPGGVRRMAPAR